MLSDNIYHNYSNQPQPANLGIEVIMRPDPDAVKPQPINLEGLQLDNPAMLMHPNQFATFVGLSVGVVGSWIDNGYLPTVKIGKYRLINLLKLKELLSSNRPVFSGFSEVAA